MDFSNLAPPSVSLSFCSAKVQRAERAVEEYRNQIDLRKEESYGFASMAAVPYAHTVANMLRNRRVKGATITLAPNPKDIVGLDMFGDVVQRSDCEFLDLA